VDWTVVRVVVRLRIDGVGEEKADVVAVVAEGAGRDLIEACAVRRPSS
jgi:hypothetical protein